MRLTYIITPIVVLAALGLGVLTMIGPKLGLQVAPQIESKAISYIDEHKFIQKDEEITGYKAISYYNYDQAVVFTNKRLFWYENDKVHSIPLDKISMVVVKDSDLGHQDVIISAETDGIIKLELYHSSVPKLIEMLKVSDTMVKHYEKNSAIHTPIKMTTGKV